jgi:hypothetical protein
VISCRHASASAPDCDPTLCTCCDSEGSLLDASVTLTPDCHLSVEFKSGDSNDFLGCKYLDKYPNQTTTIVFMCDQNALGRGVLEPSTSQLMCHIVAPADVSRSSAQHILTTIEISGTIYLSFRTCWHI